MPSDTGAEDHGFVDDCFRVFISPSQVLSTVNTVWLALPESVWGSCRYEVHLIGHYF